MARSQLKSRIKRNFEMNINEDENNFIDDLLKEQDEKETSEMQDNEISFDSNFPLEPEKEEIKPKLNEYKTTVERSVPTDVDPAFKEKVSKILKTEIRPEKEEFVARSYTISNDVIKQIRRKAKMNRCSIRVYVDKMLSTFFDKMKKSGINENTIQESDYDKMEQYAKTIRGDKGIFHLDVSTSNVENLENYSALYAVSMSVFFNYIFDSETK